MHAVEFSGVTKTFLDKKKEVRAVDDASWSVPKGAIHGLLGPNGAGKTTMISMLSGILHPSSGDIQVFGKNPVTQVEEVKKTIGVVPQELVYEMAFTVREVLHYFSGMYGVSVDERKKRIPEILEALDLADKADVRAKNLSGGMKRRLMIAKAMLHQPKLLVLDEPTAGVDVALRQRIWELVRKLHANGTTILLTTHYLEEAEALCSSITVVNKGKIVRDGSLREIRKEFDRNVISFDLAEKTETHLPEVVPTEKHSSFQLETTDLSKDLANISKHYGSNLLSVSSGKASLEEIFLHLTNGND